MLAIRSRLYAVALAVQLLLYVIAALGKCNSVPLVVRIASAPRAFCMMNVAVAVGLYRFIFTRGPLWKIWIPTAAFPSATADVIEETTHADAEVNLASEPISGSRPIGV